MPKTQHSVESLVDKGAPSIRANSRKNRVYVFRDFLRETYCLSPGDVIIDAAGGKGDLSWLLINVDGLDSVVLDPRSLSSTSHLIRSVHWLHDHPEERAIRAIPNRPSYQPLAALVPTIMERKVLSSANDEHQSEFLEPQHLQVKLDNDLINALRDSLQEEATSEGACPTAWKTFWQNAQTNQNCSNSASGGLTEGCFLPESERDHSRTRALSIEDPLHAWRVFQSARLIIGFHPDQATEACLDLADLLRVPVCICPCCVFPSEFPDRTVLVETLDPCWPGGSSRTKLTSTRVRDYQQFLQYLQQKQPKLRKETLAFHETETSRNIVLYTLPVDI